MARVMHIGDIHLRYQQYHSPEHRQDFLDASERVVANALDGDVDVIVHAGDLYHNRRPELPNPLGTLAALRHLGDAGIPFFAIVGNHESARSRQWLDLFEHLGLVTKLGRDLHVAGGVAFYDPDHVPRSHRGKLDYQLDPIDTDRTVFATHGLFMPFIHADWETEIIFAEPSADFDAALLGDDHVPDTAELDGTWITCYGSTERVNADEHDPRGYNLVESTPDAADIRRRTLETRPFTFVKVDLAGDEGIERVRQRVREFDLEDAVVTVELRGEGGTVTPAAVESFAVEEGTLAARIGDKRDIDDDGDLATDVIFADPGDAVRERVREMGLSNAALDVDKTVRANKTADSNVRDEARKHIGSLLSDSPDAFVAAEHESDTRAEESESVKDTTDGEDTAAVEDTAETAAEAATDTGTEATAGTDSETAANPTVSRDSSLSDSA